MIKVMIADDHPVVRRGLRQILAETSDLLVGGEAGSPSEIMQYVHAERWDVIVLDISLQGGSGLELIGDIRRVRSDARVLVLTVHPEEQYALRAIRAGAAGFMNKECAPEQLIGAIRKLASGGRYVSAALAEALASAVAGEGDGEPHERLSDRELEVLKLLASGKTVTEAAELLSLSVKTVSTHRTRILRKMSMTTTAQLTHYAVRNGLVS